MADVEVEDDVDDTAPVVAARIDSPAADAKMVRSMAEVSLEDGNKEEQESDNESDYIDDSDDYDDDDLHHDQHSARSATMKDDDGFGDTVVEKSAE